ncbi:MAG: plasmid pRiA4b ORF-3 family protein [Leptolyngbya sp.]|nr:plasmid pRiA4b ORF-3 family protein [Leptolyngbya sp.]
MATLYQLKITLRGSKPPIWRRVQVPGKFTLAQLHEVIQAAMGWYSSHLYQFEIGSEFYSNPAFEFEDSRSDRTLALTRLIPGEKFKFHYAYDMGDDWGHTILVEKVLSADPKTQYPLCLKGKRACPPEDCGGIWGYGSFLETIADPNHPDHEDMLEWVGGSFDPEAFDLAAVNDRLQSMR